MTELPLFPVTTVGSWPRSPELLKAQKLKRLGRIPEEEFELAADNAVLEVLRLQEEAGVDIVTDGEQRRDNFYSFVAEKLEGVRLMTLAELAEVVEDRAGFEKILQTMDVPAYSLSNPSCVGKIRRREPLALKELEFLKKNTDKPIKVPLPGPYLLTRSMFVKEITRVAYSTKELLAEDVVTLLRAEIEDLIEAGANFIQLDEPVLTELVFTQGQTRTFMCAALAARQDPEEELQFATALINRVLEGFDDVRTGVHVCRGNWSRDESTLLRGSYHPLRPSFGRMQARQLVLEYATERAGDVMPFDGKELGLGVVNPRTEELESPESIRRSVDNALSHYSADAIFLNPDCGFGTFSNRPIASSDLAVRKLEVMVEAAQSLR